MKTKLVISLSCLFLIIALFGCASSSKQQKGTGVGAATGAGVGALLGQAIGGDTESTLIGAGAGAIVGGIAGNRIGNYMDKQERDLRNSLAEQRSASIQREEDVLRTTFQSDVFFDFDSAKIKPGGRRDLEDVAEVLKKYRKTTILIEGHTDKSGPEEYNQRLSERRAQAVKNALIQMGIIEERLKAVGYGESQPISSDPSQNRRVEISIQPIRQG